MKSLAFERFLVKVLMLVLFVGFSSSVGYAKTISKQSLKFASSHEFGTFVEGNCLQDPAFDACIFYKNPVAHMGDVLSDLVIDFNSPLNTKQTFGVKLPKTLKQGVLKTSTFDVNPEIKFPTEFVGFDKDTGTVNRLSPLPDGSWKYSYEQDGGMAVGQLMAHFWLNSQVEFMKKHSGHYYLEGKKVNVDTWNPGVDDNAFWVNLPAEIFGNEAGSFIVMGQTTNESGEGVHGFYLSAEVYLHEAGHGNFDHALRERKDGGNCKSQLGCLGAIHEGQADYHAIIMFPEQTASGETIFNDSNGLSACGLSRDVSVLANLSAQEAYQACALEERNKKSLGEVHAMGSLYASIWWEVRNSSGVNQHEIDTLFTEHLKAITSSGNFIDAYDRILTLDKSLFKGKYGALFTKEYQKRGLLD